MCKCPISPAVQVILPKTHVFLTLQNLEMYYMSGEQGVAGLSENRKEYTDHIKCNAGHPTTSHLV